MAIKIVELMDKYGPQHLCMRIACMKFFVCLKNKETGKEGFSSEVHVY